MSKIYQDGVTVDEILMGTVDCDGLMLVVENNLFNKRESQFMHIQKSDIW